MGTHSSVELDRMKGSIGLLVALCFSSITSFTIWEDGKEYHFLEESAIHVGTNDLDSSASGFRMMSDVKVQVSGNDLIGDVVTDFTRSVDIITDLFGDLVAFPTANSRASALRTLLGLDPGHQGADTPGLLLAIPH